MKSLALISLIMLLSLSSFAKSADAYNWLFQDMKKAESLAETVSAPKHGEYFFGDNEARMLIYDDATVEHALQLKKEGKFQHFAIKSEDDKRQLRELIDQGYEADALVTHIFQTVEIDEVKFNLIALLPKTKFKTLDFRGYQYSTSLPGFPGLRAKHNRTVTLSSDKETGALVKGEIYQMSLSGLLQPVVLPLVVR